MTIHPTAIIEEGAQLGADVSIGPFCVVGPDVRLGDNVVLKSHVVVDGHTIIGDGTVIYPFASIGSATQDLKYAGEASRLTIGRNNKIREYVTMNPGTYTDDAPGTVVGDNGLFMIGVHVAHDCIIGDNVIMANNATLAGHVVVGDFVIIGGLAAVLQFIRIGEHAIIGGMSGVEADVIPYGRVKGERASLAGLNLIGLERRGFDKSVVRDLQKAFKALFADDGTMDSRLELVRDMFPDEHVVQSIISFAKEKSKLPLCQPQKK